MWCILLTFKAHAYDFQSKGIYYKITQQAPSPGSSILWTPEVEVSPYSSDGDINSSAYKGEITIPQYVTYNGTRYYVTGIAVLHSINVKRSPLYLSHPLLNQ